VQKQDSELTYAVGKLQSQHYDIRHLLDEKHQLIFNLDEIGLSDWEERKPKLSLIPMTVENADLHSLVDRGIRRQMLLCCVSASGNAYCPLLLCSNPAALSIFQMGIRHGIDLRIKIQPSLYLNKDLFLEYVRDVFLPAVESNRELSGCRRKLAILFYDDCSCHWSDEIIRDLAPHGVLLITCQLHSLHNSKLSASVYLRSLNRQRYIPRDLTQSPVVDHVLRVSRTDEQATTSTSARGSWQNTGPEFIQRDNIYYLSVDESKIRQSATFSEVRNIGYPESELSAHP
jgi:hypothetical protein